MGEILTLTEDHIIGVANLYMRSMRGQKRPAGERLRQYFTDILLNNPWVCEDIPSLVYLDRGSVAGFMGVVPRPMEFQGRAIRVAATTQFMVDRDHRGPAAIALLSRLFKGPQELAYGDGASEDAHRIYTGVGGHPAQLYSFNWLRPLRPLLTAREYLDRGSAGSRLAGRLVSAAAVPVEYLLSKMPQELFRMPESPLESRKVDSDGLLQCIQEIGWKEPLKPVYEPAAFRWLMSQTAVSGPLGDLQMTTVHEPDGAPAGWHVYWAKPGGPAQVLQIGVRRPNQFDNVLLALFRDSWKLGASSVKGQSIPRYLVNLTNQNCLFRLPNTAVVFHSRDAQLVNTLYRGQAALSRLDGECWMHFSDQTWD